jgi:hypothetical protein
VNEDWRIVPSKPSLLASSDGRIMIAAYCVLDGSRREYGGTPTRGQWDGARFIYARKGHRTLKVARLVCEAFHGSQPHSDSVCMHMDENSRHNRPDNLAWGTQKENLNAPGFLHYCRGRTGENSPTYKAGIRRAA